MQISCMETLQGASGTAQFVQGFTNARACQVSKKVIRWLYGDALQHSKQHVSNLTNIIISYDMI